MPNFDIRGRIGVVTAPFERGIRRATEGARRQFTALGAVIAGALSINVVRTLLNDFTALSNSASSLRLPVEQLQRFSVIAQRSGTDVDEIVDGLFSAEEAAFEAEAGVATYANAFRDLNINAREFLNLDVEERLMALADAYANAEDRGLAVVRLQESLGETARRLVNVFAQGGDGIRSQFDELDVLENSDIDQIREFNDQIIVLSNNLKADD